MNAPWAIVLAICTSAVGDPSAPPAADAPAPAPALGGPRVAAVPATLIRRDLDGRLVRPDHPIEEDAVALLDLDAATRAKVEAVLARRAERLDRALLDHLDLVIEAQATFAAGTPIDKGAMGQQIVHALAPVTADGTLDRQIREVLPVEARRRFASLLREFWSAVIDDGRRGVRTTEDRTMAESAPGAPTDDPRPAPELGIIAREQYAMLAGEVRRSFERLQRSGGLLYAILTRGIDVTEAQRGRALAACEEFVHRTAGAEPSPAELARFVTTLAPIFDDAQREQVIANARGGYHPPVKQKPGVKPAVVPK